MEGLPNTYTEYQRRLAQKALENQLSQVIGSDLPLKMADAQPEVDALQESFLDSARQKILTPERNAQALEAARAEVARKLSFGGKTPSELMAPYGEDPLDVAAAKSFRSRYARLPGSTQPADGVIPEERYDPTPSRTIYRGQEISPEQAATLRSGEDTGALSATFAGRTPAYQNYQALRKQQLERTEPARLGLASSRGLYRAMQGGNPAAAALHGALMQSQTPQYDDSKKWAQSQLGLMQRRADNEQLRAMMPLLQQGDGGTERARMQMELMREQAKLQRQDAERDRMMQMLQVLATPAGEELARRRPGILGAMISGDPTGVDMKGLVSEAGAPFKTEDLVDTTLQKQAEASGGDFNTFINSLGIDFIQTNPQRVKEFVEGNWGPEVFEQAVNKELSKRKYALYGSPFSQLFGWGVPRSWALPDEQRNAFWGDVSWGR